MLKQDVVDCLAAAIPQEIVLDLERSEMEIANADQKKILSLESETTFAFQSIYEKNSLVLNQRLKSNQESAKQFNKVNLSVPNLVLNNFQQLRQDTMPLVVAMMAQVYSQMEQYTDTLTKALKNNAPASKEIQALIAQNPIEKNYFFLPYQLVRTLLNFSSISDDFEADKFGRATNELRNFFFRLYFNREAGKGKDEQLNLMTTFVGQDKDIVEESVEVYAFENCFYWQHERKEYLGFTIGADFRNLLLSLLNEVKDGNKFRQVLPYTRIDWHFLHFLPQRNNLRQMYLFIKSNIYNNSSLRVEEASFEYSLDDLKRFMGVTQDSHYADNDGHFVRDKIRKVLKDLEKTPGCEYNVNITTRAIKTPGGLKQKLINFNVQIKKSFTDSHKAILKHIKTTTKVSNFKNDWLIFSCIRYCTVEQLCARIDLAYGKFLGVQKNLGISKKYDHLTIETQVSRFLSDDLQKYWQELASNMLVVNPLSSRSRLMKEVAVGKDKQAKIFSSPAVQLVPSKKRGRPPKDKTTVPLPKMSSDEKKLYKELNEKIDLADAKSSTETQVDAVEETTQAVQPETKKAAVLVQQELLVEQRDNVIVFPKDQVISEEDQIADAIAQANAESVQELDNDYRVTAPANFPAPPHVDAAPWEAYSENEVKMELSEDAYNLESIDTFIINTDNLRDHLQPVNGNTDHYAWVNDYLEHMNDQHQSDANSLFYDLFNLTAILNIIEHDNKQFQSRYVKYIDLYREKLNIVFQTLLKFYGTYEQRNDQTSVYSFLVEKTAEILFESSDISTDQRMFARSLFVRLAEVVKAEKKVSLKEFYSLRGQCVAYPFA